MEAREGETLESLRRNVSGAIVQTVFRLPPAALSRGDSAEGGARAHVASGSEQEGVPDPSSPFSGRLGTSRELNRLRYEESRRVIAAEVVSDRATQLGGVCFYCLLLLVIATIIAIPVLYIQGWRILVSEWSKACDWPIKWWLLAALVLPPCVWAQQCYRLVLRSSAQGCIMGVLTWVGVLMYWTSQSCSKTSPTLYSYAGNYAAFLLLADDTMGFFTNVLVAAVLGSGPCPAHAARPGLIREVETVEFDPALFCDAAGGAGRVDTREPSECSVCQEEFRAGTQIKRTPCGHFFHEECLGQWLEGFARTCPNCRMDLEGAVDGGSGEGDALLAGRPPELGPP